MTTTAVEPAPPVPHAATAASHASGESAGTTSRRPLVIAHVVPAATAGAVTFNWFQQGRFVAAGDVAPFMRDGLIAELPSSWGHQLTGAGSASHDIVRALDIAALQIAGAFGWSEPAAQHLLYGVLFAAAAASGALLTSALTRRPSAIAIGGLLAVFNPFVMLHLPNPLPVVNICVIAATGALALRRARNAPTRATTFALATVPVSYLAVNPPSVAVTAVWMTLLVPLGTLLAGRAGGRRVAILLVRAAPIAVLLNAWWIVPIAQVVIGGDGPSIQAETDAAQWEWSHAENDLASVATLTAHWGWDQPGYYPFARSLDRGAWPILRWALPAAALGGLILARRPYRRLAVGLSLLVVVAIVLAKGVHPPGAGINRWLYERVPGLWLLREPVSKLGPLISLGYAALAALAVDGLLSKAEGAPRPVRRGASAMAVCVLAAALTYPFPLWTGAVLPADRAPLPSAHVQVAPGWRDLARAVNGSPRQGKVLVLPLNRYYQTTTSWGYHGVDVVAHQLLERPVLQRLPGGYFSGGPAFTHLLESVQAALRAGDTHAVPRLLDALGVSQVVLRRDLVANASGRPAPSVAELDIALSATPELSLVGRFGVADLYEHRPAAGMVAAAPSAVRIVGPVERSAAALSALRSDAIGVTGDVPADGVALELPADTQTEFSLRTAGLYRVVHRLRAEALYTVSHRGGDESAVTVTPATRVRLDGALLPVPTAVAPIAPDTAVAIETAGRLQPLERDTTVIAAPAETEAVIWARRSTEELHPFSAVQDCNAHDRRGPDEAGLRLTNPAPGVVQLEAASHSACVSADFEDPLAPAYRITLEHRSRSGRFARLCVWQEGPDRCAELARPVSGSEWQTYTAAFRPALGTTGLRLYLYADGGETEPTVIQYRNPTVEALHPAATVRLPGPDSWSTTRALDRGPHTIEGSTPGLRSQLGPFSPVQDCYATRDTPRSEADLTAARDGAIIRLSARAHSACVSAPVTGGRATRLYRIRLEHRSLRGRPARICMWEDAPQRCADLPPLARSSDWAAYETTFRPDPATNRLDLYLYADGTDDGTTVEYRSVTIQPVASSVLVLAPAPAAADSPELSYVRHGSDQFKVLARDASGPFLIRLADAYGSGWKLSGLPPGWSAEHLLADAYANGWLVSGSGSASLLLTYAPSAQARAAIELSLLSGAVIAVLAGRSRWARHRQRSLLDASHGVGSERRGGMNASRDIDR